MPLKRKVLTVCVLWFSMMSIKELIHKYFSSKHCVTNQSLRRFFKKNFSHVSNRNGLINIILLLWDIFSILRKLFSWLQSKFLEQILLLCILMTVKQNCLCCHLKLASESISKTCRQLADSKMQEFLKGIEHYHKKEISLFLSKRKCHEHQ